jgi:hypothetical protein
LALRRVLSTILRMKKTRIGSAQIAPAATIGSRWIHHCEGAAQREQRCDIERHDPHLAELLGRDQAVRRRLAHRRNADQTEGAEVFVRV